MRLQNYLQTGIAFSVKHLLVAAVAVGATALTMTANAGVLFDEDFESYALGDSNGQGGWVDFGGTRPANIVNTIANGGTQSHEFSTNPGYGSDSTLDLAAPITTGRLEMSFDLYIPTGYDGIAHIFLSRGPTLSGTFDEGLHILGDGGLGLVSDTASGLTAPLLRDQWVAVAISINLDTDTAVASYGGIEIHNGPWNNGGASPTQYQGLDFWAAEGNNVAAFNIDNLLVAVVPEPSAFICIGFVGLGLVGWQKFKRFAKSNPSP